MLTPYINPETNKNSKPPSTGRPGGGGGGIGGGTTCPLTMHVYISTVNSTKKVFFFILYPPRLKF
nr:hypothetical protein [Polaribacter haliotis]